MKILITIKTYPIPSAKYDELVCTAGVTDQGSFVRLYPVNFRDLPWDQQYRKYQWIEVDVTKHTGRDTRPESFRPDCASLRVLGKPIDSQQGTWSERAKHVLPLRSASLEELVDRQARGRISLGIFRPKSVHDLVIVPDDPDWKPQFKAELLQARLWEQRGNSRLPPRKVPFKFRYQFTCDDTRCKGTHEIMIEDWEVGALYWRLVDGGATPTEAAVGVRDKFLTEICGPDRDTHFYVGTVLAYPKSWVIVGTFYPRRVSQGHEGSQYELFG